MSDFTLTLMPGNGSSMQLSLGMQQSGLSLQMQEATPTPITVSPTVPGPRGAMGATGEKGDKGDAGADAQVTTATPQLTVDGWIDNSQTVSALGVTLTNFVIVAPSPTSQSDYVNAGIICVDQNTDTLTFTCETIPSVAIDVNVGVIA